MQDSKYGKRGGLRVKQFDLTEFNKLRGMLDKAKIPHIVDIKIETKEQRDIRTAITLLGDYPMNHYQIIYPDKQQRKSDVVISYCSYGHENGLLEQMGLLPSPKDDVEGWLDAETVFQRWQADFYAGQEV